MKKNFLPFKEARKFVRSLGLKSKTKWEVYRKSHKKPDNIPTNPQNSYKKDWKGWGDWLGTTNISGRDRHKQFRSFGKVRAFARSLKLKSRKEWEKLARAGKLPNDIPRLPDNTYKNKGWTNWGDFLGTGTIASRDREFISFEKARKFARKLGLKGQIEWTEYATTHKKLLEKLKIPAAPSGHYKNEFMGWGDWLGTGNIQNSQRKFWSFKKARSFARELGLKTLVDWKEYCKSGKIPKNIPTNPNRTYEKEWKSWGDWLGNDKVTNQEKAKNRLPLREAGPIFKELEKKYGIKNRAGWTRFARTHKELLEKLHLPTEPWAVYPSLEEAQRMMKK